MRLQPYNSYQALNIEWNQSAPAHWYPSRLKFDSYIKARVGWHGLTSEEFTESGPYLITGSDFSGKVIDWSNCYHCDLDRYEQDPYIQLKDDDLLITKDGTIGKVILTGKLPDKATLNSGVFVLRPLKKRYDTKYYYWLMQSSVFHGFVEYYRTGSTIAHLYQGTLSNLPYALPPIAEQTQIASFLDRETAKIDRLIEKQQRLIELLKEKRQAVISHAVTKGLNPDVPMKDSGVEWLGETPQHWDLWKLSHFSPVITCGVAATPEYTDDGVIFLSAQNVKNNKIDLSKGFKLISDAQHKQLTKYRSPSNGDILMSRVGTVGEACIVDVDYEFSIFVSLTHLRLKQSVCLNKFFIYSTESRYFRSMNEAVTLFGGGVGNLNVNDLRTYKLPLPPISEQQSIVDFLDEQTKAIAKLISCSKKAIHLMKERRTALISAAVTGKIDVRDQVPQDAEEAVAS